MSTIRDNSKYSECDERIKSVENLVLHIANRTLIELQDDGVFVFPEVLKKESDDLSDDQVILESNKGKYKTGNVMGFIGYGEERLVIRSRFDGGGKDYLFQYLLSQVFDIPNIVNLDSDADVSNRLLDYLVFMFPFYLKTAIRKGVYKEYIWRQYNDSNVKGMIDIKRHIKVNTPFLGKVAYNQREFSHDNTLIELVRHTIEFIKTKRYGANLLRNVSDEVKLVVSATSGYEFHDRRRIVQENQKNVIRHAYYREYYALQKLCLMILRHQRHQIGEGGKRIYGILFDGSWLWEEYINKLCGKDFYHPRNKIKYGKQYLFHSADAGRMKGEVYPDFISRSDKPRIIVDAKYKPSENIGNRDYLQMLAYMFRFDSKKGIYVYPENENGIKETYYLRSNVDFGDTKSQVRDDVEIKKMGIIIPGVSDDKTYDDFERGIKKSEESFLKTMKLVETTIMDEHNK